MKEKKSLHKITLILWLASAGIFLFLGLVQKQITYVISGLANIGIGCSLYLTQKSEKDSADREDEDHD